MAKRTCSVKGCGRLRHARGWCPAHYQRWRKTGDAQPQKRVGRVRPSCSVAGCDNTNWSRGMCDMHYRRWWRSTNRDRANEWARQWRIENPERSKANGLRYRTSDRGRSRDREYQRRWREANREESRARMRRWYRANPEQWQTYMRTRRARLAGNPVIPYTAAQLRARLSMFPGCWLCGGPPDTIDHVKPVAVGGGDILANLRPACRPCNSSKGSTWPIPNLTIGRPLRDKNLSRTP